MQMPSFLQYHF